ncbi:tripartite tricarboxylate transporter TctB family protein [Castellaniella sp. GW247-6E4]|uniref:tripartite tricarboxylate transporter TctB family protein n=1 Tax=Castellaniella sp. GW247-6E4 TaxID=3140380 RepID=UPI003314F5FF
MRIKSQKDFFSGLLFVITGACFGWGATAYRIGTSAHMGPGYFPLLCSALLVLIGLAVCIKSLTLETADGEPIGRWAGKPLVFIILANALFAALLGGWPALGIPAFGFVLAAWIATIAAARAGSQFRLGEAALLATVLALGGWLIFVKGLGMQLPAWPGFIAG